MPGTENEYRIVSKGSHQGREVLLSRDGYTLAVDRKRETADGHVTYWKCSNRKTDCKARVIERQNTYEKRGPSHNHEPDATVTKRQTLSKVAKFKCSLLMFQFNLL